MPEKQTPQSLNDFAQVASKLGITEHQVQVYHSSNNIEKADITAEQAREIVDAFGGADQWALTHEL